MPLWRKHSARRREHEAPRDWEAVPLESSLNQTPAAIQLPSSLVTGDALLLVKGIASCEECNQLLRAGVAAAEDPNRECSPLAGSYHNAVRLSVKLQLPEQMDTCKELLRRVLSQVDMQWPSAAALFGFGSGDRLTETFEKGLVTYTRFEPAINVYYHGGSFDPHVDGEALTILIPLSPPSDYSGGGTSFWSPTRPPPLDVANIQRPEAGTAIVWAGHHVKHAARPVESGMRVVLVASFSRRWPPAEPSAVARPGRSSKPRTAVTLDVKPFVSRMLCRWLPLERQPCRP